MVSYQNHYSLAWYGNQRRISFLGQQWGSPSPGMSTLVPDRGCSEPQLTLPGGRSRALLVVQTQRGLWDELGSKGEEWTKYSPREEGFWTIGLAVTEAGPVGTVLLSVLAQPLPEDEGTPRMERGGKGERDVDGGHIPTFSKPVSSSVEQGEV